MRVLGLLLAVTGYSAAVAVSNSSAPQSSAIMPNSSVTSQVRVAFHGDNGMMVSWNTFKKLSKPTVMYGLSSVRGQPSGAAQKGVDPALTARMP